ncbi:MAG TPA: TIGR04282 family arsenosugar biosynthesis glycosyltransferase [Allosphingosinicella sp.]|nr:TIGR04282 family arsenosugar biosynthesis glycosyltransferase [Allosphingosinicella sp.]
MGTRIVIFAKAPVPGHVKTRLIPALGAEGAARLAHCMLLDTYGQAASVPGASTELCTAPAPGAAEWDGLLPPGASRTSEQGEGDLGARLARAAQRVTAEGDRVVLIGTDCPDLDRRRLESACRKLEEHDAIIHPTFDGGYALLGLSRFDPSIFSGIAWSSRTVAADTIARIQALGWSLARGETLRDVDQPEDLAKVGW